MPPARARLRHALPAAVALALLLAGCGGGSGELRVGGVETPAEEPGVALEPSETERPTEEPTEEFTEFPEEPTETPSEDGTELSEPLTPEGTELQLGENAVVDAVALPGALPGILTGLILALSRAIGETAPLVTLGALTYVPFAPDGIWSPFTVLPIQIFNWISRPQAAFAENAAAGIIVLLALLLTMNAVAIVLRDRYQRRQA